MTAVKNFAGRVAIVTGAGAGLGRDYALELARRGCRVLVNDLGGSGQGVGSSQLAAQAVVEEITAAGGLAVANGDSVATRAGGRAIVEAALAAFGRLDILISNAGILRTGRFDELTDEDIDAVLDVHLKGAFYVGQPAFTAMKQQGYGRILFTASSSGLFGHPWQASYGAAKSGMVGLSNVVALEGKDHGVLCNVIMPNAQTRLADAIDWSWAKEVTEVGAALARISAAAAGETVQQRLTPEWVTPLAIHLVSEQSTTTHGIFSAANGRFARVMVGAAAGWAAADLPSAEDVATHWAEICDVAGFTEPHSVYDEVIDVRTTLRQRGLV
jgi:NAD(P)-dependent dehydrogenase (short-subunit alcohol dehydrogenase family)